MGWWTAPVHTANFNNSCFCSTVLLEQHLLLHFFQVKAGSADLVPIALPVSLTRHDLLKAGPNTCEYQRPGGWVPHEGLESLRRGGTEQHWAGASMQTIGLFHHGPEGHATQVLHFLVTGGRVVAVTTARKPADLRPLPLLGGKLSVDALQFLFRAVVIEASMEKGPDFTALILLVLELIGRKRGQCAIPSSLSVDLSKLLVLSLRVVAVLLITWGVGDL